MRAILWLIVLAVLGAGAATATSNSTCPEDQYGEPCYGNGDCLNGQCKCDSLHGGADCSYTRREQIAAFFLSFFLGEFGADRYYLGYIAIGTGKLVLTLAPCIFLCVFACTAGFAALSGSTGLMLAIYIVALVVTVGALVGSFVWWLVDLILIAMNTLHDYHGYAMKPW